MIYSTLFIANPNFKIQYSFSSTNSNFQIGEWYHNVVYITLSNFYTYIYLYLMYRIDFVILHNKLLILHNNTFIYFQYTRIYINVRYRTKYCICSLFSIFEIIVYIFMLNLLILSQVVLYFWSCFFTNSCE